MSLYSRLAKLEAMSKPQHRNLITFRLAGRDDDEIKGADLFGVMYQRSDDETIDDFIQRLDNCPARPAVTVAMMTYAEIQP